MSYDIPAIQLPENSHEANVIEAIVSRDHVTVEEAVRQLIRSVPSPTEPPTPTRSMASFFGVGAGRPGAYGSREAVDRHIQELRDEW